jgi:hypothetical protein
MKLTNERKRLCIRFALGYFAIIYIVLVVLGFSMAQGAGWRPVISGSAAYLFFFLAITYQFIRELRRLGRKERGEKEPLQKKGPWEDG